MIFAAIVYRLPFADGDRAVVEDVIGRVAVFQREGEDEGLEAGAGLAFGLGGPVEGGERVVDPAGERDDAAGAVKDQGGGLAGGERLAVPGEARSEQALRFLLDFRVDRQLDDGVTRHARQHRGKALCGSVQHIAKLGIVTRRGEDGDLGLARGGGFLFGDEALALHFLQHVKLAGFGAVEIFPKIELRRGLGQGGEKCGLVDFEL